jgi:hypothetical protein
VSEALVRDAASALRGALGRTPVWAAHAPGRVNLIGEHTDYNAGLVLPCAIDRGIAAVAAPRDDALLRVHSEALGVTGAVDPERPPPDGWLAYVAGVAAAFREAGLPVRGLDVALASDLPRESGLSSSAALEVVLATLLDAAAELGLAAEERARLAWRAETAFVGVPCGRMDQLASALGRRDHALRIDCRDFTTSLVPLPAASSCWPTPACDGASPTAATPGAARSASARWSRRASGGSRRPTRGPGATFRRIACPRSRADSIPCTRAAPAISSPRIAASTRCAPRWRLATSHGPAPSCARATRACATTSR